MKTLLTDAYKKASDKNDVGTLAHEAWETLQTMFRLIKSSMSGEYTGVPGTTVAAAVAVLIYFLSPIDLIPDFIPVLGLLDDVALVAWFSTTLKHELDRFHEWEATRPVLANSAAAPVTDTDSHKAAAEQMAASMSAGPASAAAPERPEPARGSAKQHGTVDLPPAHSNTDSGLGTPESSSPRPVHEAGPDAQPTGTSSGTANTWEGSRNGTDAGNLDSGGNVR
ncbi:MAG: hypothetical protein JWR44_1060 [Hymenobacter sp.]|nr:hypothetical protein [Hymenobacter sp.]